MNPGLKHVFMTADAVGGVWTYALDLAAGLAARGVRTTLAVLGPPASEAQVEQAQGVAGLQLLQTELPLDWTAAWPNEILDAGRHLAAVAALSGAEIIHLNHPALAMGGRFRLPVVGVAHSCLSTWWDAVKGGEPPRDFIWRIRSLAEGYQVCDRLIAPTAAFAAATARAYDRRPTVVHNGRRSLGRPCTPRSEHLVFTAGRLWDEGKNLRVLDQAAALLAAPVFAAGPLASPTGETIRFDHLQTLGPQDETSIHYWLCRARLFVSAALYEPFGLSVLEAAQAGCGLVLADIPTFRELWDGAARFVPAEDPQAIAEALRALLDDPAEAARLGEAARSRAARYSVEAMTAGVLDVYAQVMARPSAHEAAA